MPNIKHAIIPFLLTFKALFGFGQISSQDSIKVLQTAAVVLDSLQQLDSLTHQALLAGNLLDSLKNGADSLSAMVITPQDSTYASKGKSDGGDVETTIDYKAKDSIFFDLTDRKMYMYGDSKVDYGNMSLAAERINVDWTQNALEANHVLDTAGRKRGKPVFTEQGTSYETDDMRYNFKSRKAIINGIITEQQGAIMHGERVKKNEKDEMFVRGAKYTTCDLAVPHFHINSSKLKVIPNNKILSGPFNLHFGNIPTPIGFPFGLFPEPQEKSSGVIFPSYGEDFTRGFFLRQLGYYFYMGEYIDLRLTGDIFSKGSYGLQANTTYRVRYKFRGNMNVRYNKTVSTQFENNSFSEDMWINWSHTPESFGTSRFSASVSGGTSTFTANNNNLGRDFNSNVNAQFSSNISYSKTFRRTPFNMSVNARHSQDIGTGRVTMTLPDFSFNVSRILPFKSVGAFKNTPLNKLGFTYKMAMKNELTNAPIGGFRGFEAINRDPLADSIVDFNSANLPIILQRAKRGIRHQIPIATSFPLTKNITISPSFNYTEVWYANELRYEWDAEQQGVRVDTLQGFSRAGWYSGGASMSTRLYGFFPVGGKRIEAIRHVVTPSLGFSMSPDFSDPDRGYYQEVQINENGDTRLVDKYQGYAYGGAPQGESASLSFSLNNNLEMKVLDKKDTIGEGYKKISIFDNLSASTSYNILADSFNLSNINWNARTSLFNKQISVNLSGTLDPYVYVLDSIQELANRGDVVYDRRLDRYAWNNGQGLGQLSRANLAIGFNLKPKGSRNKDSKDEFDTGLPNQPGFLDPTDPFAEPQEAGNVNQFIATDPRQYVPFDVPWGLSINYNVNYTKQGFDEARITQALSFSGNISLTNKTKVNFNSGYDLEAKEFTFTQMSVARDLHCWNISFNWVPFGPRQSYFVSIQVSAATLKDLKLDRRQQPTVQVF